MLVHKKTIYIMAVIQVTSREFREKQKNMFDLADQGEKIIIRRGKKQAYVLTPIEDDDLYFTSEVMSRIQTSLQEANEGKVTRISGKDELKDFLSNL